MRICREEDTCPYLTETLANSPAWVAEGYKAQFCREDSSRCARLVVAGQLGAGSVPASLGPHESMKAVELMAAAGQDHPARLFLQPSVPSA
jgi:hypothetical protein